MLIPVTILKSFLRQYILKGRNSNVFPFADFFLFTQTLENKFLRKSLFLKDDVKGVLITQDSAMCDVKKNDILTHIDDIPIDNKGKINFRGMLFNFLVIRSEKAFGEKWKLTINRNGMTHTTECFPDKTRQDFVRNTLEQPNTPSFYVGSGLVFQVMTVNSNYQAGYKPRTVTREETIYIAKIFKDDFTDGYEIFHHHCVASVNGTVPRNIRHLIELFEKNSGSEHTILVYNLHPKDLFTVVLPNLEKDPTTKKEFLNRCGVFSDRSYNLSPEPRDTLLQFSTFKSNKEKDDEKGNLSANRSPTGLGRIDI